MLYAVRRWQCGRDVLYTCDDGRRVKGKVFSSSQHGGNKLDTVKQKDQKGAQSALAFCAPFVCPWRGGGFHGHLMGPTPNEESQEFSCHLGMPPGLLGWHHLEV